MSGLSAGHLDREVTIQQRADGTGTSGFPVDAWTPMATVWMQRMNTRGSERFRAAQLSVPVETRWRMPYQADMDPDLVDVVRDRRLFYMGRIYDITSVEEIGRQEGLELLTLASSEVA